MKIELVKDKQAYRAIMIDGVRWGTVRDESHGPRGKSYHFEDAVGRRVTDPYVPPGQPPREARMVVVHSDAYLIRTRAKSRTPFDERMFDAIRMAVARKLLRHPEELQEESLRQRERIRHEQDAGERERDAEFRKQAIKAIGPEIPSLLGTRGGTPCGREVGLQDRIIEAMKWAIPMSAKEPFTIRVVRAHWLHRLGSIVVGACFWTFLVSAVGVSRVWFGGAFVIDLMALVAGVLGLGAMTIILTINPEKRQSAILTVPELRGWLEDGAPRDVAKWQREWRGFNSARIVKAG